MTSKMIRSYRRICVSLLLIAVLAVSPLCAAAGGLLGDFDDLFGQPMPSPRYVLNRNADSVTENEDGMLMNWENTGENDYLAFSRYLGANGCTLLSWQTADTSVTCLISGNGEEMTVRYDQANSVLSVFYPAGTREEDQAGRRSAPPGSGILPTQKEAFLCHMPDLAAAAGKTAAKTSKTNNGGTVLTYTDVTENDYNSLSRALYAAGCSLEGYSLSGSSLTASVKKEEGEMSLVYDYTRQTLQLTYNASVYVDPDAVPGGTQGLLPSLDSLWKHAAPDLSNLMHRAADTTSVSDGTITETWNSFGDDRYPALSDYLEQAGCNLNGYTTEGKTVLFQLEKNGVELTVQYDRQNGKLTYSRTKDIAVEKGVTPTPKPSPTPTPRPTPAPTKKPTATPKKTATPAPKRILQAQKAYDAARKLPQEYVKKNNRLIRTSSSYTPYDSFSLCYEVFQSNGYNNHSYTTHFNMSFQDASTKAAIKPRFSFRIYVLGGSEPNLVQLTVSGKTYNMPWSWNAGDLIVDFSSNLDLLYKLMNSGGSLVWSNMYPSSLCALDLSKNTPEYKALSEVWNIWKTAGLYDLFK